MLIIIACFALWFLGKAGIGVMHYFLLRNSAWVKIDDWSIETSRKNIFLIKGEFTFDFQGKQIYAKAYVDKHYPNNFAAELDLKKFSSNNNCLVWFNPNQPEKAEFARSFPTKAVFSALLLVGLVFYFLFLGKKVAHYDSGNNYP